MAHGDRSRCWKEEQNKMNIDPQGWSTLDRPWPIVLLSGVMAMAGAQCFFLLSSLWSFSLTSQASFFWKHHQLQKFLECSITADKSNNKTQSKVHFFFFIELLSQPVKSWEKPYLSLAFPPLQGPQCLSSSPSATHCSIRMRRNSSCLSENQSSYFWLPCYDSDVSLGTVSHRLRVTNSGSWSYPDFLCPSRAMEEQICLLAQSQEKPLCLDPLCQDQVLHVAA